MKLSLLLILLASPAFAEDLVKVRCRVMKNGVFMPEPKTVPWLPSGTTFRITKTEPAPKQGQWADTICWTDVPVPK